MPFLILLALTTIGIAGAAAFFSIYGLAQIFSGAFIPVVVMGSILEAGKLVAASYVYRYWKNVRWYMKTYLITAVIVLMTITSAGIFGFLTSAHQKGVSSFSETQTKVVLLEQQKAQDEQLKEERLSRRKQIDAEIANLPSNFVRGRQKLSIQYGEERAKIETDVQRYTTDIENKSKEISDLKLSVVQQEAHVGPILYVAKALGRSTDDAIIWMTYLIMFAFDPLAVVLTIGFNIAMNKYKADKLEKNLPPVREMLPITHFTNDQEPTPTVTDVNDLKTDDDEDEDVDWMIDANDDTTVNPLVDEVEHVPFEQLEEDPPTAFQGPITPPKRTRHPPNIRRILKLDKEQR